MKTFVQEGEALAFTCPVGGVTGGTAYLKGSLVVVAAGDVSAADAVLGVKFEGVPCGVFILPKPDELWRECDPIYFDETASPIALFTNTIGSPPLRLVGVAAALVPVELALATDPVSPAALTLGTNTIQVTSYVNLADNTVSVTVKGVAHVLTEGSGADFLAETSDEVTATNLGAALALIPGITVIVSTDTVTITVTDPPTGLVRLDGAAR